MGDDFDIEAYIEAPYAEGDSSNSGSGVGGSSSGSKRKYEDDSRSSSSSKRSRDDDRDDRRGGSSSSSSRRRSRSPPRRDRDRDRDRGYGGGRGGGRDRDYRDRDRDRDYHRGGRDDDRGGDPDPVSGAARENQEIEREQRTVFVRNMPVSADRRKIVEFFEEHAGKVKDVKLITDRSRKSKGIGYVEFAERETVQKAIGLTGTLFNRHPIVVQLTEAEKNRAAAAVATPAGLTTGPCRLYVGNLHQNIGEEDLKEIFTPFGELDFITMQNEPNGRSKGYCFVQFKRTDEAKKAMQQLNGIELAGKEIKVDLVHENGAADTSGGMLGELDDDDGGGLTLNAQSRAMLMQKLQHGQALIPTPPMPGMPGLAGVSPFGQPLLGAAPTGIHPARQAMIGGLPGLPGAGILPAPLAMPVPGLLGAPFASSPQPSVCILLKNMFDPKAETSPTFDQDIKEDVEEECGKFGPVKHCFVDKNSLGYVYLKFLTVDAAASSIKALNGRWFASKMITAEFFPEPSYKAKFPNS